MRGLWIILTVLFSCVNLVAQETITTDLSDVDPRLVPTDDYRLELHLIGGVGATLYNEAPSIYADRKGFFGYNVNVRLMWHPNHLLSIGLMSGYQVFSRQKFEPGDHPDITEPVTFELNSVPIHLAFEVRPLNIRFGAGLGVYLLQSQIRESAGITHSDDFAYGGSAWVGYTFALSERVRLGPDVVVQILSDRGISNFSAMVTFQYDLLIY